MKRNLIRRERKAQTAIEYMLLLAVVVTIVLVGFRTWLPQTHDAANVYFDRVSVGILGKPPRCGDGSCGEGENFNRCCEDCQHPVTGAHCF